MEEQNSLKKNAVYNVLRTLMQVIFPLITFPYASRVLLPVGLGKVNFANSIIQYFALLGSLGISNYGIREAAKIRDQKKLFSQFIKEIFTINSIATLFSYVLFLLALFLVPKFRDYRVLLCICSATILFTTLGIEWIYSALEDFKYITIRSFIFQCISLMLLFIFVKTEDDYIKYAAISVFSNVGSNICNFLHSRKFLIRVHQRMNLKRHVKPIFILFSKSVAVSVYTMLDVTMLGFMSTDKEVGIYTAATKMVRILTSLIIAATAVFMPRLSYYAEQNNYNKFQAILKKSINFLLFFSIPSVIGLIIISKPIILLLSGNSFAPSIKVMQIMSPLLLILSLSNFNGIQIFIPLRKDKYILYTTLVGAFVNFILNYFLIPRYYSAGAGFASVIAELSVTFFGFLFVKKYFDFRSIIKPTLQYCLATISFILPLIFIVRIIQSPILQVFLCILVAALIYVMVLFLLKNRFIISCIKYIKNKFFR